MRRVERLAIERLTDAGANTAERAILLERNGRVADIVYKRLGKAGALVFAGNDRYYLNREAYDAFRRRRQRRALIAVTVVVIISAALYGIAR